MTVLLNLAIRVPMTELLFLLLPCSSITTRVSLLSRHHAGAIGMRLLTASAKAFYGYLL